MPELPEVETIKSQLNNHLPLKVQKLTCSKVISSIAHTPLTKLKKDIILKADRKGKMLIFHLASGDMLLSHLGMTGSWRIGKEAHKEKHAHLKLIGTHKNKEAHLSYVDPRRFGHMYLYSKAKAFEKLAELGVDLLDPKFTLNYLIESLKRYPERQLKVTLLDQSLFAGTGNYIASEICARAKIRPTRRVKNIKKSEFLDIYNAFSEVLNPAIDKGGTTFQGGYADTSGDRGAGVTNLVVFYQKICGMCKTHAVKKIILAQRGTYYCPSCQK